MLPVPIEALRVRIGLESTDASKDTEIEAASATALALMGNYCDRLFPELLGAEEVFTHYTGFTVPLMRYPITGVASIVDDSGNNISDYHVAANRGIINLDARGEFHELTVTYDGGYPEGGFPPDLLSAFYGVFDQEYALNEGGAVSTAGEISSVTMADVGTVKYNTSAAAAESSAGAGAFLPARSKSLLDSYMRYRC